MDIDWGCWADAEWKLRMIWTGRSKEMGAANCKGLASPRRRDIQNNKRRINDASLQLNLVKLFLE